jgi:hypothetical protein
MLVTALSDAELVGALKQLVARETVAITDVVEHLTEVDARKLHVPAGCSSLTAYCRQRLGYSDFEAAHRVRAARLVQQYPMILPMLRAGTLCLSTLWLLAPVLTASNHRERLEAKTATLAEGPSAPPSRPAPLPDGDIAKIIKRAVKDLRTAVETRKFGKPAHRKTVSRITDYRRP